MWHLVEVMHGRLTVGNAVVLLHISCVKVQHALTAPCVVKCVALLGPEHVLCSPP